MKTMVERVVEVLDEKNPYMDRHRVLYSRIPKKRPVRKKVKPIRSTDDRRKEQERRRVKERHPNSSLKWNGQRWITYQKKKEEMEQKIESLPLQEISLRTGFIGGFLLKVKQYGKKVDQGVTKLKSLSSRLNTVKDDKDRDKIQSEIVTTDSEVFSSLRKMIMYVGLVSGSGGIGGDRTYKLLKKMEKRKRR